MNRRASVASSVSFDYPYDFESCAWSWGDSVYVPPAGTRATDAVALIAATADTARIVIINERHHAASDRLLTLRLLGVLRQKGYRYFAAEAFDWADTGLNHRRTRQRTEPAAAT